MKPYRALAEFAARHNLRLQAIAKANTLARPHLAPWPHQRLPVARIRRDWTQQKDLDFTRQILPPRRILLADRQRVRAGPMPVQPRRKDARIVQHQAIAGPEELR